jgi:hypothetical protein
VSEHVDSNVDDGEDGTLSARHRPRLGDARRSLES